MSSIMEYFTTLPLIQTEEARRRSSAVLNISGITNIVFDIQTAHRILKSIEVQNVNKPFVYMRT